MLHLQYTAGVSICIIPNTLFSQLGIIKTNASYTWEEENNSTKGFTPLNFSTRWYPVTPSPQAMDCELFVTWFQKAFLCQTINTPLTQIFHIFFLKQPLESGTFIKLFYKFWNAVAKSTTHNKRWKAA